jgi:hypothetical protein
LQEPYGLRCYLGKILLYSCHNKNLPQSPLGGNIRLVRCQGKNAGASMEFLFTLHGTCGRKGIGRSLKMYTRWRIRWHSWQKRT